MVYDPFRGDIVGEAPTAGLPIRRAGSSYVTSAGEAVDLERTLMGSWYLFGVDEARLRELRSQRS